MGQPLQMTQEQFQQLLEQFNPVRDNENVGGGHVTIKPNRSSIDIDTTEGEWAIF